MEGRGGGNKGRREQRFGGKGGRRVGGLVQEGRKERGKKGGKEERKEGRRTGREAGGCEGV